MDDLCWGLRTWSFLFNKSVGLLMNTLEQENSYLAELARLSSTSFSITAKVVEIQLAMLLRDLGVKGESQTFIGKLKLNKDGSLSIEKPNMQIQKMLDNRFIVEKISRETDHA